MVPCAPGNPSERDIALRNVFIENRSAISRLGAGHRQVVETMNPKFASPKLRNGILRNAATV